MSIYSHSNVIGLSWNSPPDGKCEIHDYLRLKCPTKLTPPALLTIMSQDWTLDSGQSQIATLNTLCRCHSATFLLLGQCSQTYNLVNIRAVLCFLLNIHIVSICGPRHVQL